MALVGNYSNFNKLPLRYFGAGGVNNFGTIQSGNQSNFVQSGRRRSRMMQDQTTTALTLYALPNGSYPSLSWFIPQKAGQIGSSNQIYGNGVSAGNLAGGLPTDANLNGAGNITNGNLTLIAQLIASLTGAGDVTPPPSLIGKLELISNNLTGSGAVAATLTAFASVQASLSGAGSLAVVPYATGDLSANILSYGALTPQGISDAVWAQIIESGLTSAEILRIMASALAGKVSGAGTGVETFVGLNQVTNRITSTVDANGNRISVVVDGA